jgi:hypothetical protein
MPKPAEIKTKQTTASVDDFVAGIEDEQKRADSRTIIDLMAEATKEEPRMWGTSIVGFGFLRYKSPATGREVDWFRIGFAPRKANLTLYFMGLARHEKALQKLGKYKVGGGCLYIKKLSDVDMKVLKQIISEAAKASCAAL